MSLDITSTIQDRAMDEDSFASLRLAFPYGSGWINEHDGYVGTVVGWYITREGKPGVDLQLADARVVHVYHVRWLREINP